MKIRGMLRSHARQRGAERFDLKLSRKDCNEIRDLIRSANNAEQLNKDHPNVLILKRLTCTRSLCAVKYQEYILPVIYSKSQKEIVTILPKEELNKYPDQLRGFS